MNLWLVPVDERSFQRTLAEPVDLSDWEGRPDSFPEVARVWGVRTDREQGSWERNRRNFEKMEPGDPLLVYRHSVSRFARIEPGESHGPNTPKMTPPDRDEPSWIQRHRRPARRPAQRVSDTIGREER